MTAAGEQPGWTFLTNHAHVLVCVVDDSEARISEIADRVGIGQRATQSILNDLVEAGYLRRTKVGRRNRYDIDAGRHLRHPLEAHHQVGELIAAVGP